MQSCGDVYCRHCQTFVDGKVGVGQPMVIALLCGECYEVLATARPDYAVRYEDLPAYARLDMVRRVAWDDGSEAFRTAAFGVEA